MTSPDANADSIHDVLGDFRIVREIGRGGMGIVYEAQQISLNRRVAVKVLPLAAAFDEQRLERFRSEVRAASSLSHPNIVCIYVVGCERGVNFYAMQYVEGRTLGQMISDLRQQQIERGAAETVEEPHDFFRTAADLGIQAAEALHDAHERGIVHRDVKPTNLIVDTAGHLWVTDFGIATTRNDIHASGAGGLSGTMRYMSPEQIIARGDDSPDRRTDIYSLGVTLYELLTLQAAFSADERHGVMRRVVEGDCRLPRQVNPAIPPALEAIVRKAMQPVADQRYATAAELADDLRRFCDSQPTLPRQRWAGPLLASAVAPRRRVVLSALAALVVLAACGWFAVSTTLRKMSQQSLDQRSSADSKNTQRAWDAIRKMTQSASESPPGDPGLPVNQDPSKRQVLEDAIAFYEPFTVVDSTEVNDRLRMLRAFCEIGTLRARLRQYPEATACLQAAIGQAREYADADENQACYRRQLADGYARFAAVLREQGRWDEARDMGQQAVAIQTDLIVQLPEDTMLLSESGQALCEMALVETHARRWQEAVGLFRQAIDRQQSALKMTPGELEFEKRLCNHYVSLNDCLRQGKIEEPDQLEGSLRQIVYWSQQIVSQQPGAVSYKWRNGDACQALAELLSDSPARLAEATQWAEKAVDCFEKLAAEDRTVPVYGHRCGHAVSCLAQVMQRRGELAQCRTQLERALRYLEASVRSDPANKAYPKCQAVAENNLAWFLVTCTDPQLRDPQVALQHAKRAVDLNPGEGSHWNTLGVAHYRNNQYTEAVAALTKSLELNKGAKGSAKGFDLFCLAMAHWQLNDQETARRWYQEAVRCMDEDASSDAELQRFREEATELLGMTGSSATCDPLPVWEAVSAREESACRNCLSRSHSVTELASA